MEAPQRAPERPQGRPSWQARRPRRGVSIEKWGQPRDEPSRRMCHQRSGEPQRSGSHTGLCPGHRKARDPNQLHRLQHAGGHQDPGGAPGLPEAGEPVCPGQGRMCWAPSSWARAAAVSCSWCASRRRMRPRSGGCWKRRRRTTKRVSSITPSAAWASW